MRQDIARRALSAFVLLACVGPAAAQTREQIREQNERLYQQYQQSPSDAPSGDGVAPPLGGASGDDAYVPPPRDGGSATGGPAGGLLAQLLDRVNRLEEQNRQLSGRVDELERELQTQTAALNKQIGDLGFAMQQGGHPADAAMPAAPAPAAAPPARAPAGKAVRNVAPAGRTAAAIPPGPRGAGAAYQLARSYAADGNYRQAAVTYYDAYNRQPRGPLAADALLHVSASMMALGQNGAACEALAKFRSEFPNPRPNIARTASALRARGHC